MVWDKTKPSNVEKIQDLGNVIRPNWQAIEEASNGDSDADKLKLWSVNLYDRNNAAVTGPNVPARIDDAGIIYCRQDASASPQMEFFFEDQEASANEVQITQKGKLGSSTTSGSFQDITIGTGAFVNEQNNFVWAHGVVVAAGGAVIQGQGLGTATITTASSFTFYRITLTRTPANANYHVFVTCFDLGGSSNRLRVGSLKSLSRTTGQFDVLIQRTGDSTWRTDVNFQVMVMGGF